MENFVKDTVNCSDYVISVAGERNRNMEHGLKNTNRGKLKYSQKNLPHCQFIHQNTITDWPVIKPCLQSETKTINRLIHDMANIENAR